MCRFDIKVLNIPNVGPAVTVTLLTGNTTTATTGATTATTTTTATATTLLRLCL